MIDSDKSRNSRNNKLFDVVIRKNTPLFLAGICFIIYSIIEILDCIYLLLILLDIVPNIYQDLGLAIPEIQNLLKNHPIYFLPFFISFTLMRIVASIGIFKNRLWGFYIGLYSLMLTMILTMMFIPIGMFELFFCSIIFILLFIGYYKEKPILSS